MFVPKIGKKWAIILTELDFWGNDHIWKIAFKHLKVIQKYENMWIKLPQMSNYSLKMFFFVINKHLRKG